MPLETHSAFTALDDIIDELKLSYDSSVGILDGEAIREIPSLNVLLNLSKLMTKLENDLNHVESIDGALLESISAKLNDENGDAKVEDAEEEIDAKHKLDEVDDEESVPLAKRQKPNAAEDEATEEPEIKTEDQDHDQESREQVNSKDDPVPPVQEGHFNPENDTRLKNPKSEFVESQTLPKEAIAELGLFSEDGLGLEVHGKEYLRKKYGVASYPERDLQDMLPGEIPDNDFSKNKPPSNQVQFTTFQTYIEPFFRPFTTDDISFLNEKHVIPPAFENTDYDPNITPYLIPKLGPFYADVWADEDVTLASKLNTPEYSLRSLDSYKPKGSIDALSDEKLYTESISCGPLSSRLLSAILNVNECKDEDDDEEVVKKETDNDSETEKDVATKLDSSENYKVASEVSDFHSIEERLKRELKYIGIFMNLPSRSDKKLLSDDSVSGSIIDSDEWIKNREDDEICAEIRELQKELKEASARNRQRKKKLIPLVEEQLAYQEYCIILDDLDKQVDQAYVKRIKAKNKKKKHIDPTPQQQAVNNGLRILLDKRQRWIDNIGKLFPAAELMKRVPKESVFKGDEPLEDDDDEGDDDVVNDAEALLQDKL